MFSSGSLCSPEGDDDDEGDDDEGPGPPPCRRCCPVTPVLIGAALWPLSSFISLTGSEWAPC